MPTEKRKYEISAPNERANIISSQHTFAAEQDIVFDRYDYSGSVYRPSPDVARWRWETAPPLPDQRPFTFPEKFPGKFNKSLMTPPAKWMAKVERPEGETRGVLILDHPKNPRYPTCWGGDWLSTQIHGWKRICP